MRFFPSFSTKLSVGLRVCLRKLYTNMADSNRCQANGHVTANQEYQTREKIPRLHITRRRPRIFYVNRLRDRLRDLTLANTAPIQELGAQTARFEQRLDNLEIGV